MPHAIYNQEPFGKFRIEYNPLNRNVVTIKTKIHWEFAEDFPDSEDAYKQAAIDNIKLVWDNCRSLTCTGGTYDGRTVRPVFVVEEEGTQINADFTLTINSVHGGAGLIPSESRVNCYRYDAWTKQELSNSLDPGRRSAGSAILNLSGLAVQAANEMERMLDQKKEIGLTRTSQAAQSWSVNLPCQTKLRNLVNALNTRWPPRLSRPALTITASSGVAAKAQAMVNAVRDFINGLNPPEDQIIQPNPVTTGKKFKMPFTQHKTTGQALLSHEDELALLQNNRVSNEYCTLAHEYGHCLGLPDEYCHSSMDCERVWEGLIEEAGAGPVPPRDRAQGTATAETGCIMHSGIVVEKRHLVTIWRALTDLLGGTWRID